MNKGRGSKTSSPKSNSSRPSSPPNPKQATNPSSPEEGQVTRPVSILSNREQDIEHRRYSGKSNVQPVHTNVNFLKKNRKAVQKFYKRTGIPSTPGEHSEGTIAVQLRTKIGTPHLIGDELGTPSNKGSSFFLSASHNGAREPHKRVTAKKRQNSNS